MLAMLAGCGGGSSGGGTDLSSPKATMKTILDAMRRGDSATIQAASINGDPQVIDMMTKMGSGMSALRDAAVAKWGDAGKDIAGKGMPDFDKSLENADVKENGDTATVTPTDTKEPITLKKVSGDWKLDWSQAKGLPSKDDVAKMAPMTGAMADAAKQTADEIKAGKYATVTDAQNALQQKMMASMMSKMPAGGPGGAPGGAPAIPGGAPAGGGQ
jgi:hypothetical protein